MFEGLGAEWKDEKGGNGTESLIFVDRRLKEGEMRPRAVEGGSEVDLWMLCALFCRSLGRVSRNTAVERIFKQRRLTRAVLT